MSLVSAYKKIIYWGTGATSSSLAKKRIILCNQLCIICILITLFFIGWYSYIGNILMVYVEIGFTFLYCLPIFFNYCNQVIASRIYFNVLIVVHVFFLSVLLGPKCTMYNFFIPLVMAPFILFEFQQRRIIGIMSGVLLVLITILYTTIFSQAKAYVVLTETQLDVLNKIVFYTSILCTSVIIYSLLFVNEATTKRLDASNDRLQAQLEAIFDNSADALFLVKWDEGKIVKANASSVEIFEATAETDFYDKKLYDLQAVFPLQEEMLRVTNLLKTIGIFEGEIVYKTFKGKEFWGAISLKTISIYNEMYLSVRITNVSENHRTKNLIEEQLKEKEILLAEVHHRVKNNLAIISALINLQIDNLKDEESKIIFEETKDRIYSMALIHNQLYQNNSFAKIEFSQYISNFCSYLVKSYQTNLNIEVLEKTTPTHLEIKTAIPCALILNELITNAFKHAFKNQNGGKIEVGLKTKNEKVLFWVADSGTGMDRKMLKSVTMGMSLVTSLVEQIDGKLDYTNEGGSRFLISFAV